MAEVAKALPPGATWSTILAAARTSGGVLLAWTEKVTKAMVEMDPSLDPDQIRFKEWQPERDCRSRALRNPPAPPMGYCPLSADTCPENPDTPEPTEPGPTEPGPYGAVDVPLVARRS
jgi:hypothetical protein